MMKLLLSIHTISKPVSAEIYLLMVGMSIREEFIKNITRIKIYQSSEKQLEEPKKTVRFTRRAKQKKR